MQRSSGAVLVLPLASIVLTILAATAAALFMSVRSAHAEIEGPCSATINAVDVAGVNSGNRGDDISVSQHSRVPVSASSPAGFRSHKIQLEFASRRWTVSQQQDDGSTTWSDTVNVDDYARYGVGLYKVIGVSLLNDGTTCEGAATVDVAGNPLTTVAGAVATGVTAVGTLGAVGSAVYAATGGHPRPSASAEQYLFHAGESEAEQMSPAHLRRRGERFGRPETPNWAFAAWLVGCLCFALVSVVMMPLLALMGAASGVPAGAPGGPAGPRDPASEGGRLQRLPRAIWLPRITILGLVSGFLAGAGGVVLLQQYSIEYPTLAVIIRNVVIGMVVYGLVLPTLGYTVRWVRVNRRVAAVERSMGLR